MIIPLSPFSWCQTSWAHFIQEIKPDGDSFIKFTRELFFRLSKFSASFARKLEAKYTSGQCYHSGYRTYGAMQKGSSRLWRPVGKEAIYTGRVLEGQRSHVDQEASGLGVPKREALVTHQVDVLFRHVVIQDDPDGHHGGGSGWDGGVHQDDVVVLDVLGQAQVVQLGFPGLRTCLRLKRIVLAKPSHGEMWRLVLDSHQKPLIQNLQSQLS